MEPDLVPLVTRLARRLVDDPDAVEVRALEGSPVLYEIRVAPSDRGRIIGREGRTIRALRLLVGAAARKAGTRASVEVVD